MKTALIMFAVYLALVVVLMWVLLWRMRNIPFAPECPKCGSEDVHRYHFAGSGGIPECTYRECENCGHQFDQT